MSRGKFWGIISLAWGLGFCTFGAPSYAIEHTNFSFHLFSQEHGLPNNNVWSISQDQKGFMWFGTRYGGLARYDGYTFKVFEHDENNSKSISHNYVWTTLTDSHGQLWVGTNGGGLNRYDERHTNFIRYPYDKADASNLPHANIKALFEDKQGTLWVGSNGGISRYDRATDTFSTVSYDPEIPNGLAGISVRAIEEDQNTGLLWLGTRRNGLSLYDPERTTFVNLRNRADDITSLSDDAVNTIHQDRFGKIWVGTRNGLNVYDPKSKSFQRFFHDSLNQSTLSGNWVQDIYEDRQRRLWVATLSGLNLYDRVTQTFLHLGTKDIAGRNLQDAAVNTIFEDRVGAMWFGTVNNGIDRLDPMSENFTLLSQPREQHINTQAQQPAKAVLISKNGVKWVGTSNGLDRIDTEGTTHFAFDANDPHSLSDNNVRALAEDQNGQIWVGTLHGLNRFNGISFQRFVKDAKVLNSISGNNILALSADQKGGIWISVNGLGVDYFDGQTFTAFQPRKNDPTALPSPYARALLPDALGSGVWVGTNNMGLAHIDLNQGTVQTYLIDPSMPSNEVHNFVRSIVSAPNGILWLATNFGLSAFDPLQKTFAKPITTTEGLSSNTIMSIDIDDQGGLWVGMSRALNRVSLQDLSVHKYKLNDRYKTLSFLPNAAAHDQKGNNFFGTEKGLLSFNPGRIVANPNPPPVVLIDMNLFDQRVQPGLPDSPLTTSLITTKSIDMRYDQSFFSFTFSALDFTAALDNLYTYKLEGFDREWRHASAKHRQASYTNVPPGHYVLRVKAANNDGVWNEDGVTLPIVIHPPWWNTAWFYALAALAVLLMSSLVYMRIRYVTLYRQRELEAQVAERTDALVKEVENHEVTEEALVISEKKFRNIIGNMPDIYFCLDKEGCFTDVSQEGERLLGYTHAEFIGTAMESYCANTHEHMVNVKKIIESNGDPVLVYAHLLTKDGREVLIESHSMAQLDKHDEVIGIEGIARDVTVQKFAEAKIMAAKKEAEDANQAKTKFLAAASHDLRQPMQAMTLILYSLGKGECDPKKLEMIELLEGTCGALGDLLNSLLDISRLEAGMVNIDKEPFALGGMLHDIMTEFQLVAQETNTATVRWVPSSIVVYSDRIHVENILRNFISNAIKCTDGGDILVGCRRRGDCVDLQVYDTGDGIDDEEQAKIFDEFYQVGNDERNKDKGLGLGLSIVQRIAKLLGHKIGLRSSLGKGSLFWLRLPQIDQPALQRHKHRSVQDKVEDRKLSIIVVDDEENIRAALGAMLNVSGHDVTAIGCTEKPESLAKIHKSIDPNIIVADYRLANGKTGVDAIADIRREVGEDLPAILLTGDTAPVRLIEAAESGFVLLHKPIQGEELMRTIYSVLDQH